MAVAYPSGVSATTSSGALVSSGDAKKVPEGELSSSFVGTASISATNITLSTNVLLLSQSDVNNPTGQGDANIESPSQLITAELSDNTYIFARYTGTVLHQTEVLSTPTVFFDDFGIIPFIGGARTTVGDTGTTPTARTGFVSTLLVYQEPYYNVNPSVEPRVYDQFDGVSNNEVLTLPRGRVINFGVVTFDKPYSIIIENKRMDSITYVSSPVVEGAGVFVEGMSPGQIILSQGVQTFKLVAKLTVGDTTFSGWFPVYFDKVTLWFYVDIIRQPLIVYSLAPDKSSYKESYTFKTLVYETLTKKETRVAMMKNPKKTSKYSVTATNSLEALQITNYLYLGMNSIMYQPRWAFWTKATADVVNSTVIPCDTYQDIFKVDDMCCIYKSDYDILLLRIIQVNHTAIELSLPVTLSAGTFILPMYIGTPEQSQGRRYSSTNDSEINVGVLEL